MISTKLKKYVYSLFDQQTDQCITDVFYGYCLRDVAKSILKEDPVYCHGGSNFQPCVYVGSKTNRELKLWLKD